MKLMRRQLAYLLLSVLIPSHAFSSATEAYNRIKPLIFQIKTSASATLEKSSYGSGFVIDKTGLLVTNYHVVSGALWKPEKLKIFVVIDDDTVEATIQKVDFINDLAIVKVDHQFKDQLRFPVEAPSNGDEIFSLGLPEDINWTVVAGIYNGKIKRGPYEMIHMSTPLNPGMSGGPTVNKKNELVAVNASGYLFSQQISFGVPYQKVIQLLERKAIDSSQPNRFIDELEDQLASIQNEMTKEIIKGFSKTKKINGHLFPDFSSYVKCWGTSSQDEDKKRYAYSRESCRLDQYVPLSSGTYTGSYSVDLTLYNNKSLNDWAWTRLFGDGWMSSLAGVVRFFDSESKINFAPPECARRRVETKSGTVTVAVCSQKILPLKDLYDAYIIYFKRLGTEKFIRGDIAISGFQKKNVSAILNSLFQHSFKDSP